ncbi:MAG: prolyl oligopeptidase family serine peptidase [Candidatus Eisenbacteria bacterium]|uniref:Prolyl oligopeptidase family serine peptidase n=1 Tax=Eiseniibacteriota bacterium TaxID=2212470 RepID=A0A948RW73_UNCEI|nr:prolyl oligopeptidase family serine peptidase [Candidatus Eisenbacteria bacterium]MBU1949140.1 prolyl oligopeptidase family serine peptidase [Candidatus Eisenbacteria bacterium]MBU2690794.1 prolyl oligopeptidase family serine peptidase [Candidatus Eisenbacteria bacterium]
MMPRYRNISIIYILPILFIGLSMSQDAGAGAPEAALPSLADTLEIGRWHLIGPVPMGPRDGGVEPLDAMRPNGAWPPDLTARLATWLVPGGWVSWEALPDSAIGERGRISIEWPDLNWTDRMDEWGFPGLLNAGYLYAQFTVPAACRALANVQHTSSFRLNGDWFPGAPYALAPYRVPVILKAGVNRILLCTTGYGTNLWGTFHLAPLPEALWLDGSDAVIPDIVAGLDLDAPIGIPVWNATSGESGPIRLEAVVPGLGPVGSRSLQGVAPLSLRKPDIPIKISWISIAPLLKQLKPSTEDPDGEEDQPQDRSLPIIITAKSILKVSDSSHLAAVPETLSIPIRKPNEARRVSFISKLDLSPQFFALLPPSNPHAAESRALIFSVHGASVDALNQAQAYKAKEWAYLIAPTNRRPYGFDWQDWGRRDALEVLDIALNTLPIDPDRVCLTGHSMGGHGTWAIGVHHFDRFAAMAPSAGWSHFDLYVPMTLRRGALVGDPVMEGFWHRMRIGDKVPLHIGNVKGLPVFVLHGGSDDNVPPTHGRFLSAELQAKGGEVKYVEVPGKGHWWDDDSGEPGAACVDHPEMMAIFQEARRNPWPTEVEYILCDPTVDGGTRSWVEVLEQVEPLRESWVRARMAGWGRLEVETRNIAALALRPEKWVEDPLPQQGTPQRPRSKWHIVINDQELEVNSSLPLILVQKDSGLFFQKNKIQWEAVPPDSHGGRFLRNRPEPGHVHGLKSGFMSPFVFVYGASGTAEEKDAGLQVARILARQWAYRGNGDAPILSDREIEGLRLSTDEAARGFFKRTGQVDNRLKHFEGRNDYSPRLILIGNEESNTLLRDLADESILRVRRNAVEIRQGAEWIGPVTEMRGAGLLSGDFSVTALIPDPMDPARVACLWGGTSARAILRSASVNPFYAGAGWPDFLLFNDSFQENGWAGFYGAGLWINK